MSDLSTVYEATPALGYLNAERAFAHGAQTMPIYHHHDTLELYYLVHGERYYFVSDHVISIQAGDFVLIDSNTIHRTIDVGSGTPHERVLVEATPDLLRTVGLGDPDRLRSLFRPEFGLYRAVAEQDERIPPLLNTLIEECSSTRNEDDGLREAVLLELLLRVGRLSEAARKTQLAHISPLHAKITDVVRYINADYASPLHLDGLATKFAISKYYLCRAFKRITGFTLHNYVNTVRTKEAKRLLANTRRSATFIATEVGFTGISHLDRVFYRHTGQSPTEYRVAMGRQRCEETAQR